MIYKGDPPTLAQVIKAGIDDHAQQTFTALIGKIKSYDKNTQCASVDPLVKAFDGAQNVLDLPPLVCMPVHFPSGGEYAIKYLLKPGDPCLIVFSSVSIAQWLQSAEEDAKPESPRRQSLSDGVVIPGVRSFKAPLAPLPDGVDFAMGLDDGTATLTIDDTKLIKCTCGAMQINDGSHPVGAADLIYAELLALQVAIATVAAALPVPIVPGPYVPPASASLIAVDDLTSD